MDAPSSEERELTRQLDCIKRERAEQGRLYNQVRESNDRLLVEAKSHMLRTGRLRAEIKQLRSDLTQLGEELTKTSSRASLVMGRNKKLMADNRKLDTELEAMCDLVVKLRDAADEPLRTRVWRFLRRRKQT